MATQPTTRTYNEFDPAQKAAIENLAKRLAKEEKDYLDKELKPFIHGRVLIFIGTARGYNSANSTLEVEVPGPEGPLKMQAAGCNKTLGKKLVGKSVRVLYDTHAQTVYFDDQYF